MSDNDTDHLANLSDGAGCAEVWEHLSEQREKEAEEADSASDEAEAEPEANADEETDEAKTADAVPCP
jgi:hypothetical protein